MEALTANPILKFNPNQLKEVRELYGYKDEKQMNDALDKLEEWIRKQNHFAVKNFDRSYLERIIIFDKGSVERAKQRLERTCTLRTLMSEVICNMDIKKDFGEHRNRVYHSLFPKPTKDNYRIAFASVHECRDGFNLMTYYKYMFLVCQYALFNDYVAGIEVIFDLREMSVYMMSKSNPLVAHKGITMLLQTFGSRIRALHILISATIAETFLKLVLRSLLSDKLKQRIHVHSTFESVCKVIDKSILPVEVGGEYDKTLKELNDEFFYEICSEENIMRLKYLDKAVTIESQRLEGSFNEEYSGMPGSFKSLCVD